MKFRQGYLISTGEPKRHYISEAVRHVQMRQGTIGIKVAWFSHFKLRYPSGFPLFTSVHLPGMYNDVYIYNNIYNFVELSKVGEIEACFSNLLHFVLYFVLFVWWMAQLATRRKALLKKV